MIYLTFNDSPSGIYKSQVIDKVTRLNSTTPDKWTIIAFISIRNYNDTRRKLKNYGIPVTVIPMFPKLSMWKLNVLTLGIIMLFQKEKRIQGRGVFATYLSLLLRKFGLVTEVTYDGRGAVYAEMSEYKMSDNKSFLNSVYLAEKSCILKTDKQFAVSKAMVKYWQEEFGYNGLAKVIPCMLSDNYANIKPINALAVRKETGWNLNDAIIVFSGGNGEWQSFNLLARFFKLQKSKNAQLRLLILSHSNKIIESLIQEYPDSVTCTFVSPEKVSDYLCSADYGFLVREQSITNQVASPVKYAEYLACGLKILISENLGDYSTEVAGNNLGYIVTNPETFNHALLPVSLEEKNAIIKYSEKYIASKA